MNKLKINISLDLLFFFGICFVITFYQFRYNLFNFTISFTLSIIVSILLTSVFFIFLINKDYKLLASKNTKLAIENFSTYLCLLKPKNLLNLIENLCKASEKEYTVKDDIIYLANDTIIVSRFTIEQISQDFIISLHKTYDKSIILFCRDISHDATILIKKHKLNIHPITSSELYYILEKYNLLPNIKSEKLALPIKEKLKGIFNRKKCKGFILSGLTLLGLSSFIGYPIYYIVVGTILLLIGDYLYFFAKETSSPTTFFF